MGEEIIKGIGRKFLKFQVQHRVSLSRTRWAGQQPITRHFVNLGTMELHLLRELHARVNSYLKCMSPNCRSAGNVI